MLEYGSIVWNDISTKNVNKLRSIQQTCLTAALGVIRLANRNKVLLESKVETLKNRRLFQMVKFYQRNKKIRIYLKRII